MASSYTLLYVSNAADSFRPQSEIDDIVRTSIPSNRRDDITGVLVYCGGYFAQYLEGPEPAVLSLIDRIRRDGRHHSLSVTSNAFRSRRLFPHWSLAYAGDAAFVQNEVTRLFFAARNGTLARNAPKRMIDLMRDFIEVRARFGPTVH